MYAKRKSNSGRRFAKAFAAPLRSRRVCRRVVHGSGPPPQNPILKSGADYITFHTLRGEITASDGAAALPKHYQAQCILADSHDW